MRLGVPKETLEGERRVAATPESVKKLKSMGFSVSIERGAGAGSGYTDDAYEAAGASLADAKAIWGESDVLVKIRPPTSPETDILKEGATLVSLLQPERDDTLLGRLEP